MADKGGVTPGQAESGRSTIRRALRALQELDGNITSDDGAWVLQGDGGRSELRCLCFLAVHRLGWLGNCAWRVGSPAALHQ